MMFASKNAKLMSSLRRFESMSDNGEREERGEVFRNKVCVIF